MQRDNCIVVDERDAIVGSSNKYDCHRFVTGQPSGRLHRAFSVFLFDGSNRLLLQQRATDKITFPGAPSGGLRGSFTGAGPRWQARRSRISRQQRPRQSLARMPRPMTLPRPAGVWTNTCCSHQLVGQTPDEVDSDADVAAGRAPGAAAAARRKLQHELGIDPADVPPLRYLTRLHYCARDTDTHGPDAPWGEHEVDYILLGRLPAGAPPLRLAPHPEEVAATRYVTREELAAMMDPGSGLKWSPWFRIIAAHFLPRWWEDLDDVLASGKHADAAAIHRLDC
jgi:isopentenyl-diphosphate delta-isomerase